MLINVISHISHCLDKTREAINNIPSLCLLQNFRKSTLSLFTSEKFHFRLISHFCPRLKFLCSFSVQVLIHLT